MMPCLSKKILAYAVMISVFWPSFATAAGSGRLTSKILKPNMVPPELLTFVPSGWRIEFGIKGDVNGDSVDEYLVVLTDGLDGQPLSRTNTGNRKFLVLTETKARFRVLAIANKLLRCARCYGTLVGEFGGSPGLAIVNGNIEINESGGSREKWETTIEFGYNSSDKKFHLVRKKITESDMASGLVKTTTFDYRMRRKVILKTLIGLTDNGKTGRQVFKINTPSCILDDYDYSNEDD